MNLAFFPDDLKQRRVIERYLLSVSAYVLCVAIAWAAKATSQTSLSYETLAVSTIAIAVYIVGVYGVYRSGLNRRFEDSVLTRLQMLVAIAWISLFVWSTQELRGVMLLIYFFVAMFSLFTLNPRKTAAMGLVISVLFGAVVAVDWWTLRPGFDLTVGFIQWGILTSALIWLSTISGYMTAVREKVIESNEKIRAQNAEIQLANERLQEALTELNRMVTKDELTGLSNRRHFLEIINEHIANSHSERFEFGLCVLDLDNFKAINDTHGHLVGDEVLRSAAELMRQNMREYDFLARFGGEEFTLIVTRGDEAITRDCAERLRMALANAELSEGNQPIRLTVSIGATVFRAGDTLEAALARADAAMYAAKRNGRNACVMRLDDERAAICSQPPDG